MFTHRTQKTVVAGVSLLAAGMLVSACGPDNDAAAGGGKSDSSSAQSSSGSSDSGGTSGGSDSGGSKASGATGSHGQNGGAVAQAPGGKHFRGTVQGDVKYMAPGKFTVKTSSGMVAFFIKQGAKITGYGTLCGNPGQATNCTESQLETATKKQSVPASVTLNGGTASNITERKPGTAGGDAKPSGDAAKPGTGTGTYAGSVKYLAPQKFTVTGPKGESQAFNVNDKTTITGHGRLCGEGQKCTEKQLETATKSQGVGATIHLVKSNGGSLATSLVESH